MTTVVNVNIFNLKNHHVLKLNCPSKNIGNQFTQGYGKKDSPGSDRVKKSNVLLKSGHCDSYHRFIFVNWVHFTSKIYISSKFPPGTTRAINQNVFFPYAKLQNLEKEGQNCQNKEQKYGTTRLQKKFGMFSPFQNTPKFLISCIKANFWFFSIYMVSKNKLLFLFWLLWWCHQYLKVLKLIVLSKNEKKIMPNS